MNISNLRPFVFANGLRAKSDESLSRYTETRGLGLCGLKRKNTGLEHVLYFVLLSPTQ